MPSPPRRRLYSRFWEHLELTGGVLPVLASCPCFLRLVENDDPDPIRRRLAGRRPPAAARRAVEDALPEDYRATQHGSQCGGGVVGTISYLDGADTIERVLSRRVGGRFHHRVCNEGRG